MTEPESDCDLKTLFLVALLTKANSEIRIPQAELDAAKVLVAGGATVQFWDLEPGTLAMACLVTRQLG